MFVVWYWKISYRPGASPFLLNITGVPALPEGENKRLELSSIPFISWVMKLGANPVANTMASTVPSAHGSSSLQLVHCGYRMLEDNLSLPLNGSILDLSEDFLLNLSKQINSCINFQRQKYVLTQCFC